MEYPKKVYRDGYVSVRATFTDEEQQNPNDAWWNFQHQCKVVFGVAPVEDNTIGQVVQTDNIKNSGYCTGHVNLYGLKVTPINKRLKEIA